MKNGVFLYSQAVINTPRLLQTVFRTVAHSHRYTRVIYAIFFSVNIPSSSRFFPTLLDLDYLFPARQFRRLVSWWLYTYIFFLSPFIHMQKHVGGLSLCSLHYLFVNSSGTWMIASHRGFVWMFWIIPAFFYAFNTFTRFSSFMYAIL